MVQVKLEHCSGLLVLSALGYRAPLPSAKASRLRHTCFLLHVGTYRTNGFLGLLTLTCLPSILWIIIIPMFTSTDTSEDPSLQRSVSVATGLNMMKKQKVKTIFPHTAGNNKTLLSFAQGDIITLLIPEEKDGWLYGEHDTTKAWVGTNLSAPGSNSPHLRELLSFL